MRLDLREFLREVADLKARLSRAEARIRDMDGGEFRASRPVFGDGTQEFVLTARTTPGSSLPFIRVGATSDPRWTFSADGTEAGAAGSVALIGLTLARPAAVNLEPQGTAWLAASEMVTVPEVRRSVRLLVPWQATTGATPTASVRLQLVPLDGSAEVTVLTASVVGPVGPSVLVLEGPGLGLPLAAPSRVRLDVQWSTDDPADERAIALLAEPAWEVEL